MTEFFSVLVPVFSVIQILCSVLRPFSVPDTEALNFQCRVSRRVRKITDKRLLKILEALEAV